MQPAACSLPPRSGALLHPPSFPILMLDERKLTPALGYVFNRKWLDPCESLISILWKFEKANALPGHVVARLMGPDTDPYEGVVPELGMVDIDRLHDTLAVPTKTLRAARCALRCCSRLIGDVIAMCFVTVAAAWRTATIAFCTRWKA
jgi:hypothetical protein